MSAGIKLFVGSLPWAVTSDDLKDKFHEFGAIKDAFVVTDRATGRSRGFGFVIFEVEQDAENAIKAMDSLEMEGRIIKVDRASYNNERDIQRGPRNDGGRGGYGRGGGRGRGDPRGGFRRSDRDAQDGGYDRDYRTDSGLQPDNSNSDGWQ